MAFTSVSRLNYLRFAAAAVLLLPRPSVGQGTLPVVQYSGGTFLSPWIPYGKEWLIQGPATTQRGRANLVVGQMDEAGKDWLIQGPATTQRGRANLVVGRMDEAGPGHACWVAPIGIVADSFKVRFKRATLGKKYNVSLRFYQRFDDSFIKDAIKAAFLKAASLPEAQTGALEGPKIDSMVDLEVKRAVVEKGGDTLRQVRVQNQGTCEETVSPPRVSIPTETRKAVAMSVTARVNRDIATAEGDTLLRDARSLLNSGIDARIKMELVRRGLSTLTDDDVTAVVASLIQLHAPDRSVVNRLTVAADQCEVRQGKISDDTCKALAALAGWFDAYLTAPTDTGKQRISSEIENIRQRWTGLAGVLQDLRTANLYPFTAADFDSLQAAVAEGRPPAELIVKRLKEGVADNRCFESTSVSARGSRLTAGDCNKILTLQAKVAGFSKSRAASKAFGDSMTALASSFAATMLDAYQGIGTATLSTAAWDAVEGGADRLRIGTSYGYGAVALSWDRSRDVRPFGNLALKFYRWAVDKSLPDPYADNRWSRVSFDFGVLFKTTLTFHGQTLSSAIAESNPTLGLGFDLTRDFSIQVGAIFFEQPNAGVLVQSSKFASAPFAMIAFDADIFNRLKPLLK